MVSINHKYKIVASIRGNLSDPFDKNQLKENPYIIGKMFLKDYQELFGIIETEKELLPTKAIIDKTGMTHVIYKQIYQDIPVHGGSIFLRFNKDGSIYEIDCKFIPNLNVSMRCGITVKEAIEKAINHAKDNEEDLKVLEKLKPVKLIYPIEDRYKLYWEVRLDGEHQPTPTSWVYYIDCISGTVAYRYNNLDYGRGSGYWSVDVEDQQRTVNSFTTNDGEYFLIDVSRSQNVEWGNIGPKIIINDLGGTTNLNASPSEDDNNDWNDLTIEPKHMNQGAEVDAVRYAGIVLDHFHQIHECNNYNIEGQDLVIDVHYKENTADGCWSRNHQRVRLGDGDKALPSGTGNLPNCYDYCTTDDWLAHEITHAFSEHLCGIDNDGSIESGALCEAFSDSFAAFINGDWLILENRVGTYADYARADRNMEDPRNNDSYDPTDPVRSAVLYGSQPDHYDDIVTDQGTINKHINCGIINHAIYLMTAGGTHRQSGVNVTGIGQIAVEEMLFNVLDLRLSIRPDFLEFRQKMLDSCQHFYPEDLEKLITVKAAFKAVGIGPDLYIRDTINDDGEEPNPLGVSCRSPDIIIKNTISADPQTEFGNRNDDNLSEDIMSGQDNYIYVRISNGGNHPGDADVYLYYCPGTAFAYPSTWTYIGKITEYNITPGEFRVSRPLLFAENMIPPAGHYCFIAVVKSFLDPAPDHELIDSLNDFYDYIQYCNNYAWKNFEVEENVIPGVYSNLNAIIQGLPNSRMRTDVEIDLNGLPKDTEFIMLFPEAKIRGVNYIEIKPKTKNKPTKKINSQNNLGLRPKNLHYRIKSEKDKKIFEIKPQNIGVFERILLKPKDTINTKIKVKLPKSVKENQFTFSIKQKVNEKIIGQMNYILRIKKEKK
ncbi:MAG: M4 family metallopeptidase [Candidatus Thorarchaeota archaeon]